MPIIYKITSPSGKIYIGQSWNWIKRKSVYKRIACPMQRHLYNSLLKYGYDNHKIETIVTLTEDITQEELDKQEIFYYNLYKDQGFKLLNIREAGKGGKISEETIKKISNSLKGRIISQYSIDKGRETKKKNGYVVSEETRRKIGLAHKDKTISIEMRDRIRQKLTGRKIPIEVREKISKSNMGKVHSEETRRKISIALMGEANYSYGKKGELCGSSKKVIDTSTQQVFASIKDAASFYGIRICNLQNRLNGKVKNDTNLKFIDSV